MGLHQKVSAQQKEKNSTKGKGKRKIGDNVF